MRNGSVRHWWASRLTYPLFSVIGASSYHTAENKIIIKDICCGDSIFIIARAREKVEGGGRGTGGVALEWKMFRQQQCHKGRHGRCEVRCERCRDRTALEPAIISFVRDVDTER